MEQFNDEEISANCMKLIRQFLNRPNLPNPSQFYNSMWNSNDFSRGSYSFTSKETDHIFEWERVLSEPIVAPLAQNSQNVIVFAGEHCHQKFFSTVHGAFESGLEQAKIVLKLNKELKKQFTVISHLSKL